MKNVTKVIFILTLIFLIFGCNEAPIVRSNQAVPVSLKNNTLRCGYAVWPKIVEVDPKTGELHGLFVDYLTELTNALNIKLEWTLEVAYGDIVETFNTNKVDAICAGVWPLAGRAKFMSFTKPITYQSSWIYAGSNFSDSFNTIKELNQKQFKVITIDGEGSDFLANRFLPEANITSLPKMTDGVNLLINIATNKADLTITEQTNFHRFNQKNPGKIKRIGKEPVNYYGLTIALPKGSFELKETLDIATDELHASGIIKKLIEKHQEFPGELLHPATPFILQAGE